MRQGTTRQKARAYGGAIGRGGAAPPNRIMPPQDRRMPREHAASGREDRDTAMRTLKKAMRS
jgi:hypothetical protein